MLWVTITGKVVEARKAKGVTVRDREEAAALLLLVENSPAHEDGDLLRARERLRYHGGYRKERGYATPPLEAARALLRRDLARARLGAGTGEAVREGVG
ncbi:hypothetical protein HRbin39_00126 [bacterium HR39]|nr:hypothetical protein HRbin39_00126 [bacterium HR39]